MVSAINNLRDRSVLLPDLLGTVFVSNPTMLRFNLSPLMGPASASPMPMLKPLRISLQKLMTI